MPSLRTRTRYQEYLLSGAQEALDEAAEAVSAATDVLEDLEAGTLDLEAVTVGGVRFVNDAGVLVPE
jgi:hypothetical protein